MIGVWRQTDQSELLGDHIHSQGATQVKSSQVEAKLELDLPEKSRLALT